MAEQIDIASNIGHMHRTLEVLISLGDYTAAAHIAKTLGKTWLRHRLFSKANHYLSILLNVPVVDTLPNELLAPLYRSYANVACRENCFDVAMPRFEAALAHSTDDSPFTLQVMREICWSAMMHNQPVAALEYSKKQLELSKQTGNWNDIAQAYNLHGILTADLGNIVEAIEILDYTRVIYEQHHDLYWIARYLNNVGDFERMRNNHRKAVEYFRASLSICETVNPVFAKMVDANLGFSLMALGDLESAEKLFSLPYHSQDSEDLSCDSQIICFIGLAGVRRLQHAYIESARMISHADLKIAQTGLWLSPSDQSEYDQTVAELHRHLTEDEIQSIHNEVFRSVEKQPQLLLDGMGRHSPLEPLTPREAEVLCLVEQGLTNRQIAAQYRISVYTVNYHLRNVYDKLNVTTRSAALHVAQEFGLI